MSAKQEKPASGTTAPSQTASEATEHLSTMGPFQSAGKRLDETAAGRAIEDKLEQAQLRMEEARRLYQELRDDVCHKYDGLFQEAKHRYEEIRRQNVGNLIDETLDCVRRHPGSAVMTALLAGLCLGWWRRR